MRCSGSGKHAPPIDRGVRACKPDKHVAATQRDPLSIIIIVTTQYINIVLPFSFNPFRVTEKSLLVAAPGTNSVRHLRSCLIPDE
jgi:hypothetical protein